MGIYIVKYIYIVRCGGWAKVGVEGDRLYVQSKGWCGGGEGGKNIAILVMDDGRGAGRGDGAAAARCDRESALDDPYPLEDPGQDKQAGGEC